MSNADLLNPWQKIRTWILGSSRNPFHPDAFKSIALVAFFAWVGLGADGLSSSCYGPEEAFLALTAHPHLAIYVALATALTVFVISFGYNQVVELFPTGGGGYRVASQLLGPHAGLVSGAALLIDYVLTIAISVASGVDALFSLLPLKYAIYKEITEVFFVVVLIILNLRGMKESISMLLPIFLGFVLIHFGLILYGIIAHEQQIPHLFHVANNHSVHLASFIGWFAVLGLMLHSYSLGGGTYTGLEAVSNNVNRLAEPRIRTGKMAMFYIAISLSFMAGGILLLYLLWNIHPIPGQTLNAVLFHKILGNSEAGHITLILTLAFEMGILFVAANTGFLAGPIVLANMAVDNWVPKRFRHLSSRLVTQNGILMFGVAAIAILMVTHGSVAILIVLYSFNVFLTFSLTLLSLTRYWIKQRDKASKKWRMKLFIALWGFLITASILLITVISKLTHGGWFTLGITASVIAVCLFIKAHYNNVSSKLKSIELELNPQVPNEVESPPKLNADEPTAVFFIGENISVGMHTLLWALRMFPNHFKNIIFISHGAVDIQSFRGEEALNNMKQQVQKNLDYFVRYCQQHGFAAKGYSTYGTDTVGNLMTTAQQVNADFPNTIFFASKLIFEHDNWVTRLFHNETPMALQRRLHSIGRQLVILPMKV